MMSGVKRIFFASVAALLLAANIIAPVGALSGSITRHSVDYAANTNIGSLTFSNLKFVDLSETTVQAFGITGRISNSSDESIKFTSVATYYDTNSTIIAISTNTQYAPSGDSAYTHMSSLDDLEAGYGASDISRYDLAIKTDEQEIIETFEGEESKTPSMNPRYATRDYVLDAYDVDITVHEDNTFDVTETIIANFHSNYKHGIIRDIPLRNTFKHNDGTTVKGRAKVSNVQVDGAQYSISKEDSNFRIKIGSASEYVHGQKTYTIKYTYDFGEEKNKDYDEFYFNIIGTEWDTVIGNVTFSVHMPKSFDSEKLGFSSGPSLSTENKSILFNVVDNDITGEYNGILGVGEGLTIRLTLDEGYFAAAQSLTEPWEYLIYIIPIAGAVIAFVLWLIFGNDDRISDDLQYYPPEGMNSLEMAFAFKGKVTNKDAVSLLLHLANQGYIKIVETSHTTMTRGGFKIVKLKEYDGKDENEEKFMRGLFIGSTRRNFKTLSEAVKKIEDGATISKAELEKAIEEEGGLAETTASRLRYSFYRTLDKITNAMNKKENRKKYFTNTSFASILVIILIILSVLAVIIVPSAANSDMEAGFILFFISLFYVPFFLVGFSKGMPIVIRIIWLGFTTIHYGAMIFGVSQGADLLDIDNFYAGGVITSIACIVIQVFFLKFMPKRTTYGLELYGKIKGFKKFLETAEKTRLEHLMAEKPSYAYDILPYAYVLGVSTKWMKKFEDLTMQAPDWYEGKSSTFSMHDFNTFVNHTMTSSASAMTASPSSSGSSSGGFSGGGGGSSSSGGGSSGGGGGGGGGSSW